MMHHKRFVSLRDMLEIDGPKVLLHMKHLTLLAEWCSKIVADNILRFSPEGNQYDLRHIDDLQFVICFSQRHSLDVTKANAENALKLYNGNVVDLTDLRNSILSLIHSFEIEIGKHNFFTISEFERDIYLDKMPFGKAVVEKFPMATEDISEAGKCFSFGRYTAVIFHLMRAMEVALKRIADELGATYVDKHGTNLSWVVIADNVKGKISGLPKGARKNDWCRVHGHFDSIGRSWRNDTMHPKQTYTEDEAREVYAATKGFMASLAQMMP